MKIKTAILKQLCLPILFVIGIGTASGQIIYVDQSASGTGDGASWTNAMTDLQAAIDAAAVVATSAAPIQIWVKADSYFPTSGFDRTVAFEIKDYVELYGGFAGTETLLSQRDFKNNHSILSGDIGLSSNNTDNSFSVVYAGANVTDVAVIDGFHIAEASTVSVASFPFAGAVAITDASGELIIRNCEIYNNDCTFGSGLSSFWSTSTTARVQVISSIFFNNEIGIWSNRDIEISNSMFIDNYGFNGAVLRQSGNISIVNATFYDNAVGIELLGPGTNPTSEIFNTIVWNTAGSDIVADANSITWLTAANNLVEDGFSSGTNTITDDPLFFDGPNYDLRVQHCSPAVDAGSNASLDASITEDLSGDSRIFGSSIDLGAYENQVTPLSFSAVEVQNISCPGGSDGQISVNGTGGTGAVLQYSIDGINFSTNSIFSGLAVGNYTITILDNGNACEFSDSFTITEPSSISLAPTPTATTCNGGNDGRIAGSASGGSTPYQISLDGGSTFVTGQFTSTFNITGLTAGNYTLTVVDGNSCSYTHPATLVVDEPDAITASGTIADVRCNGESNGTISVTAFGGSGQFTYSLDGSNFQSSSLFTDLSAGNYTVTVRDVNGCTAAIAETVNEPSVLNLNTSTTDPVCTGGTQGTIGLNISGGTSPYQYTIGSMTTASGASASVNVDEGTYEINVVDANGCEATASVTLTNQISIDVTLTKADPLCVGESNGEVSASATGGSGPYTFSSDGSTFQSSGSFAGLAAGTYQFSAMDANGCTGTGSITLVDPTTLDMQVSTSGVSCFGESDGQLNITVSGGTSPYEYSLDGSTYQSGDTFTGLSAGSYTSYVRDANGCVSTSDETIATPAELEISVVQSGRTFTVSGTGGTIPYEFSIDGSTFQSSGTFSNLDPGNYTLTIRDSNGCQDQSEAFEVVLGFENPDVTISPNPTTDLLKIKGVDFDTVVIFDLNGRVILTEEREVISLRELTKGIHVLRLYKNNEVIHNQKIIVN